MRVQSPISGSMTGSAGNIIFQHYNGHTYGRSKPVIFHYGPTPAQAAAQNKFYGVKAIWNPIYREIRPFIPLTEHKQTNVYNSLTHDVYHALGVFHDDIYAVEHEKIGFDLYDRIRIYQGNITATYSRPYYYLKINGFSYVANVVFDPKLVHVLYFCLELQQMIYQRLAYPQGDLIIPFNDQYGWLSRYSVHIYIALSDENFFSDFFY